METINGSSDHHQQNFLYNRDLIGEGDTVIIYVDAENILSVVVKRGITCSMKHGALRHEFLIGKPYGSRLSATAGPIYALRPYPALWTRALKRHTQILYSAEVSMIVGLLDLKPGDIVCESGTGSGSLTHALAIAVGANGCVYTHDIEEAQVEKIRKEAKAHGLEGCVKPALRDVCIDGFQIENGCHAAFLDLPSPWLALKSVMKAFNRTGVCRLVSFSPCIEQTQQLCTALDEFDFFNVKTIELINTTYKEEEERSFTLEELEKKRQARKAAVRRTAQNEVITDTNEELETEEKGVFTLTQFPYQQPTHAGYLTSATLFPVCE